MKDVDFWGLGGILGGGFFLRFLGLIGGGGVGFLGFWKVEFSEEVCILLFFFEIMFLMVILGLLKLILVWVGLVIWFVRLIFFSGGGGWGGGLLFLLVEVNK